MKDKNSVRNEGQNMFGNFKSCIYYELYKVTVADLGICFLRGGGGELKVHLHSD